MTDPWDWYIYLHLVDFNGKCSYIYIYHTWILWGERLGFFPASYVHSLTPQKDHGIVLKFNYFLLNYFWLVLNPHLIAHLLVIW